VQRTSRGFVAAAFLVVAAASGCSAASQREGASNPVTTAQLVTTTVGSDLLARQACDKFEGFNLAVAQSGLKDPDAQRSLMLSILADARQTAAQATKNDIRWDRLFRAISDYESYAQGLHVNDNAELARVTEQLRTIHQECQLARA
jgi:hypothetical protein